MHQFVVIQHLPDIIHLRFQLYINEIKVSESVILSSPYEFPVQGIPNTSLIKGLRWYLEGFLDYPFHPETDRAEYILNALKQWGHKIFTAFSLEKYLLKDYTQIHLRITSNDPLILSWPWEAIADEQGHFVARACQIDRKIADTSISLLLPEGLPGSRINILMIIARPCEGDLQLRSTSGPLLDLIEQYKLPVSLHVLRPPTFDQLESHLQNHPGYYHILHFDGHGNYTRFPGDDGYKGCLVFESDEEGGETIVAEVLGELLQQYHIPAVILDACRTSMTDIYAEHPFASVGAGLVASGVNDVLAMSYSMKSLWKEKFGDFPDGLEDNG